MSQFGEFSGERAEVNSFRQVAPTSVIRYRTSIWAIVALVILAGVSLSLGAYILLNRKTVSVATEDIVPEETGNGMVLESDYGKFYLLSSGELYYAANAGVSFDSENMPGEYGRYVIEDGDIEDFSAPASIVGGKPMSTEFVFNGYEIMKGKKFKSVSELETDNIVGSRSFVAEAGDGKKYMLVMTLGNVQRNLVYDEVETKVTIEVASAESEAPKMTEQIPVAQDSNAAAEHSDEELKNAREAANSEYTKAVNAAASKNGGKVVAIDGNTAQGARVANEAANAQKTERKTVTVVKKEPRIETSISSAKMQIIEL